MNSSKNPNENNTFTGFEDITNYAEESAQNQSSNISLELKLETVFERYCDIKEKKDNYSTKFDEFGVKIPASKLNTNSLPLTLKNFYLDCDRRSNETPRKECNLWNELGREQKVNIFKMMFRLRYEQEKNDEALKKSITLVRMKPVETSNEKQGKKNEINNKENDLLDTQMPYLTDSDQLFKYVSQGVIEPNTEPLPLQQQQQPTSSTPHKTLISYDLVNTILASPIVRSPLPKAIEQMPISLTTRRWPGMEFLGIKSVVELFTDDENEAESTAKEPPIQDAKQCSDNAIEESQYAASRILRICEEDKQSEQKQKNSSHDSSSKKRRLDIGSVRELFTDNEDENYIEESQFFASSRVKNDQSRSSSSSNGTVSYEWNQAASISANKPNLGDDKDKARNSIVRLVTGQKSDDLFSTYNESTNNISTNKNDHSPKCPSTPRKTQDSNLFVYQGSPSLLNRSLSALNCYISRSQRKFQTIEPASPFLSTIPNDTNHTVDKSSTDLNEKLEFLNSQLSISKPLDDFDEIKENFSSPYATCRSTTAKNSHETRTLPINGVITNSDMDFTDDDLFVTCKVKSVTNFLI